MSRRGGVSGSNASGAQSLAAVGKGKARRHDADHLVRRAVHDDAAADDRRSRVEAPPPQRVAQNHDVMPPEGFIVAHEVAAERRPHAERFEEAAGHPETRAAARVRRVRPGWRPTTRSADRNVSVRAARASRGSWPAKPILSCSRGRARVSESSTTESGSSKRIGPKHEPIDEVEDGGVGAEAERQRRRHGQRDERAFDQRAPRVLDIF